MEKLTANEVILWARDFLNNSQKELTKDELKEQIKYADLIQHPKDKAMLTRLLDESSQIRNEKRLAARINDLIQQYGVPGFFSKSDAVLLRLYTYIYKWFDFIAIPIFKSRLRSDTAKVIINEKPSFLNKHLTSRKSQNIGQNVNLLGEVVLGNSEADHRYFHYMEALKDPGINYISIKISGIYAQISPLNEEQNKIDLCERLAKIYQHAMDHPYTDNNGIKHHKFVNLDMEEYKDAHLTLDVFTEVLSMPAFKSYKAGIVIQAYLPDAWDFQTRLLEFAHQRVENGGAAIKIRLVKGANLQMESIISSLKGWEVPIYENKVEVDANYLKIIDRALEPENAKVANLGVASHNFFSIGYAALLSQKNKVEDYITFEMLEGMANHLPRLLRKMEKQIILYTPVVKNENFLNAVSYLVRRLDENTGKDNFLSYSFNLQVDSENWNFLRKQFEEAYALKDSIYTSPRRTQNRKEVVHSKDEITSFFNEPDTNFDLPVNKQWKNDIRDKWMFKQGHIPYEIPVQVGDKQFFEGKTKTYADKCQSDEIEICKVYLSDMQMVKDMIAVAEADASGWRSSTLALRKKVLHETAVNLINKRNDLIGVMSAITGKTFMEGDVEISEAIDFCRYYPLTMEQFKALKNIEYNPKGIVLVIPPWNFPLAIPVGGVAAALAAGNTVILKPATVAYPIAWEFAQCFWNAGVPKDVLQLVCADSRESLNHLTTHPGIKHIIMTGGTDTAFNLLKVNPTCPLSAETGGKNAIIVTASADRDHAIQNIVTSAFSNAGQKCSACSLLILDKEIYNDIEFQTKLKDAVNSLHTGSVWDFGNYVGPMVTNQNDKLLHAAENLEDGEWWLVAPVFVDDKKYMLRPSVKWGVKPGSYTFDTELFGPLLGVVCMDDLEHGISLANSSEYGLTAGLQSLDEKEQTLWKNSIEAGNLYINRGITGAIVSRQPFGGMKRSAFGGGIKAGGPNYVSCFVHYKEVSDLQSKIGTSKYLSGDIQFVLDVKARKRFSIAEDSYLKNWQSEFSVERDIHHIMGEENVFRYLPLKKMLLRVLPGDELVNILMIIRAAEICKTSLDISINSKHTLLDSLMKLTNHPKIILQDEKQFIDSMVQYERIRTCRDDYSHDIYLKAAELGLYIASVPPVVEGRLELLHYLKEQSVTTEYHRYGNIIHADE